MCNERDSQTSRHKITYVSMPFQSVNKSYGKSIAIMYARLITKEEVSKYIKRKGKIKKKERKKEMM